MALVLAYEEVCGLLNMRQAIDITENLYQRSTGSDVRVHTPIRLRIPSGSLRAVSGALLHEQVMGIRVGAASGLAGDTMVMTLFDTETGNLLSTMAYPFSVLRTGATIGVATRWLSATSPADLALIGTGRNAMSVLHGIAHVRQLKNVRVFSRDPVQRARFAANATEQLDANVTPASSCSEAIDAADLIACVTSSPSPVLDESAVSRDACVISMGSPNEIPDGVLSAASAIFVGSKHQEQEMAHYHAFRDDAPRHALYDLSQQGSIDWDGQVHELADVLRGSISPPLGGLTIFKESQGGVGDVALAYWAYQKALAAGLGTEMAIGRPSH